jgi:hypothetical protein
MSTTSPSSILASFGPACRGNERRAAILRQSTLNGIDYVEFEVVLDDADDVDYPTLHVYFLNDIPDDAWRLPDDPSPIVIRGGKRIVGIKVVNATRRSSRLLDVIVDHQGDFSEYLLTIGWQSDDGVNWIYKFDPLDRLFSVAPVNLRPGCAVDFDCASVDDCARPELPEPALDYLARDYASFRQLLIDLLAQHNPSWSERSPADVGIALLELLAAEGDRLAYFQDAVANEAYLDTARQRESAKRHARLIDYRMHDGHNARTWVYFQVDGNPGVIGKGVQLITQIDTPLRVHSTVPGQQSPEPPGPEIRPPSNYNHPYPDHENDPALRFVRVFETIGPTRVAKLCNEIRIHTWGNEQSCLPPGTTTAYLYAIDASSDPHRAVRPPLAKGDLLLFEEELGPESGYETDADPTHRQVVEIVHLSPESTPDPGVAAGQADVRDPLFLAELDSDDSLLEAGSSAADRLPLLEVTWAKADALVFPVCLSSFLRDGKVIPASVARGNIAVADHGRSIVEHVDGPLGGDRARVRLTRGPLTMATDPRAGGTDPREAEPALRVIVTHSSGDTTAEEWAVVPDLLSSNEMDPHVAVDVDDGGRPTLRFGDGEYGRLLLDVKELVAEYRIGNGRDGNIGAEGLAHVAPPNPLPTDWPTSVTGVRNPLPATGGVDPETVEEVRQHAPAAFRATQLRAVTEDDYRTAALTVPGVDGAVASFRWTGSWYTAFVGIDPTDPNSIILDPEGHPRLEPRLRQSVFDVLDERRLAGYDLEIGPARYVPLDVAIHLCVKPGYIRADVIEAVVVALIGRVGGRSTGRRGLFDPANLTFGQAILLSKIYDTVQAVDGVDGAEVVVFQRYGRPAGDELDTGVIQIGPWEIAQLDNDPSRMENGRLRVTAEGGS